MGAALSGARRRRCEPNLFEQVFQLIFHQMIPLLDRLNTCHQSLVKVAVAVAARAILNCGGGGGGFVLF